MGTQLNEQLARTHIIFHIIRMPPPPPPNPPQLLRSGHPCNPQVMDGIPYIRVDDNGNYSDVAAFRRAIPNPAIRGCYIVAPNQGGKYKKRNRKATKKHKSRRRRSSRRN
jgi:hypothetical protein